MPSSILVEPQLPKHTSLRNASYLLQLNTCTTVVHRALCTCCIGNTVRPHRSGGSIKIMVNSKAVKKSPKAKATTSVTVVPTQESVNCHKASTGKWVYPQSNALVTLHPAPSKGMGSNQQLHYGALKSAFAGATTMALPSLLVALTAAAPAHQARRHLRRACRIGNTANGFAVSWVNNG